MERHSKKREREREMRSEEGKNAADLGKVPHHTGCPADTTNSPACVCGGEGSLKDGPLIPDPASSSRLDPPSPPLNRSLIITSRLRHIPQFVNKSTHILPISGCLVESDKSASDKGTELKFYEIRRLSHRCHYPEALVGLLFSNVLNSVYLGQANGLEGS